MWSTTPFFGALSATIFMVAVQCYSVPSPPLAPEKKFYKNENTQNSKQFIQEEPNVPKIKRFFSNLNEISNLQKLLNHERSKRNIEIKKKKFYGDDTSIDVKLDQLDVLINSTEIKDTKTTEKEAGLEISTVPNDQQISTETGAETTLNDSAGDQKNFYSRMPPRCPRNNIEDCFNIDCLHISPPCPNPCPPCPNPMPPCPNPMPPCPNPMPPCPNPIPPCPNPMPPCPDPIPPCPNPIPPCPNPIPPCPNPIPPCPLICGPCGCCDMCSVDMIPCSKKQRRIRISKHKKHKRCVSKKKSKKYFKGQENEDSPPLADVNMTKTFGAKDTKEVKTVLISVHSDWGRKRRQISAGTEATVNTTSSIISSTDLSMNKSLIY